MLNFLGLYWKHWWLRDNTPPPQSLIFQCVQYRWTVCMWRGTNRTKKADKIYSSAGRVSVVAARSKPDNLTSNTYRWGKENWGRERELLGSQYPCYFIFLVLLPALVICVVLRHVSWVSRWLRAVGERVQVSTVWCRLSYTCISAALELNVSLWSCFKLLCPCLLSW